MKFKKEKCKLLHIEKKNKIHTCRMRDNLLGSSIVKKDLGVMMDRNLMSVML